MRVELEHVLRRESFVIPVLVRDPVMPSASQLPRSLRRLAELQGGRMWARSRPGGGSEFGLGLPLAPEPGANA